MTIKVNDTATFNIALGMSIDCDAALIEFIVTVWDKKTGAVDKKLFKGGEFEKAVAYFNQKEAECLGGVVAAINPEPPCPFCRVLKRAKEREVLIKDERKYKVALITEIYSEPEEDLCTDVITHPHMNPHFCPVCGKKLDL